MNILSLQHALLERRSGIAAQPGDHDLCACATDTLRRFQTQISNRASPRASAEGGLVTDLPELRGTHAGKKPEIPISG